MLVKQEWSGSPKGIPSQPSIDETRAPKIVFLVDGVPETILERFGQSTNAMQLSPNTSYTKSFASATIVCPNCHQTLLVPAEMYDRLHQTLRILAKQ